MKLSLPYSLKEFNNLKTLHRSEVNIFNQIPESNHFTKKAQAEKVLSIVDKMYEYINVSYFNKYARNRCKFYNSDKTEGVCEGNFNNTLNYYSTNGNCCRSCNSALIKRYGL
jgi:hypothetical protein